MSEVLRLLILGAHPDDAEFHAGGLATIYRSLGHQVRIISLTNGDAGHHELSGPALAARRAEEMRAAAATIGAEQAMWQHHDGCLEATLALRWQVIRELRTFAPDLVLTHRDNDYHPDHRACGHVVRDASYLVTVPAIVPEAPILRHAPVIAYLPDRFTRPNALRGDVVIDVERELETIVDMLACHRSQGVRMATFQSRRARGNACRRTRAARVGATVVPRLSASAGRSLSPGTGQHLRPSARRRNPLRRNLRNQRIRDTTRPQSPPAPFPIPANALKRRLHHGRG